MDQEKEVGSKRVGVGISGGRTHVGSDVVGGDKVAGDRVAGDVVRGGKTVIYQTAVPAPSPVLNPLHQLPSPPADFTGREEERKELRAAILVGGITISGLQGQGGVGKTALALKLAEELTPNFPDAQIYLDLRGVSEKPLTPSEAMAYVIRTFHPEVKLPEKEDEWCGHYRSTLHGKRALLLMDNARDAAQMKPLIPPPGCALLVTSRQRFALPGLQPKNLDTLPPPDAKALLLRIASRIDGEAEAIAKLCGYLPLALRLAASALAVRADLEPPDYTKQLADEKRRLELLAADDESVEASINLSYGLLNRKTQKRWRMLAVFPDTFDAPSAAAVWQAEADIAQNTLGRLIQYSMLEWNDTAKRYRLHDLMRDFASARLELGERDEAALCHATHYLAILRSAEGLCLKGGELLTRGLARLDAERGNIWAGQAWAANRAASDKEAALLCSRYPFAGAYCLDLRQHPRERVLWAESGLTAARRVNDREAEGSQLNILGGAYFAFGDMRRAVECYEKGLAVAREIGDRRSEGNALANLGVAYKNLGDIGRAIEHYEKYLALAPEIGDRRGECTVLGNLGVAYKNLGDVTRAIECCEQSLAIARSIGERRVEGWALGNLGNAYLELDKTPHAIEYYEQQLAIVREIGDRRAEGRGLGNLGNTYLSLNQFHRAIEYYEKGSAISREVGDRRGEGYGLLNMSGVLHELGEREKAIGHAEAALKIFEELEDPLAEKARKQLEQWRKG